jgi:hypothetical protein
MRALKYGDDEGGVEVVVAKGCAGHDELWGGGGEELFIA